MKYLIAESKLNEVMMNYFNDLFDVENIKSEHPYDYDDNTGEEYEDITRLAFYIENYDEEHCFKWYSCEYFHEGSYAQSICPTVVIEDTFVERLNGYFGNVWIESFKVWFKDKFGLSVKTVEWF